MSAGRCMHHALAIARKPLSEWADDIASLPSSCPYTDCDPPKDCRARVAEYLRVQYRCIKRLHPDPIAAPVPAPAPIIAGGQGTLL